VGGFAGWPPQSAPYEWWKWHDEYGDAQPIEGYLDQINRSRAQGSETI
jgi:hypothetical protein